MVRNKGLETGATVEALNKQKNKPRMAEQAALSAVAQALPPGWRVLCWREDGTLSTHAEAGAGRLLYVK